MKVHFLDVGQGDSTFIQFPNGTNMLIDCNFHDSTKLSILDDLLPLNDDEKPILDYLVITHPHEDHIRGIGLLKANFEIKNIWESGHRLYIEKEKQEDYKHYYDMLDLIKKIKQTDGHKALVAYTSFKIDNEPDIAFTIFSPTKAYLSESKPTERDIHEQCVVMKVEYLGKSILFTGDSCLDSWKERIVPYYSDKNGKDNLLDSTILHASHHGSYTFFKPDGKPEEEANIDALTKIAPHLTFISVGDNNHGHPNPEAVELYKEHTFDKQLFTTKELGTITVEFEENGDYIVNTERMRRILTHPVLSKVNISATPNPIVSNKYQKDVGIKFAANIIRKPKNQKVKRIRWSVQNNAIGDDNHHNWYVDQDKLSYSYYNKTAYTGTHTLLCEVFNSRDRLIAVGHMNVSVE